MTLSVVQVKQNVSEAGSGFSNRESVFLRNIAGCVYILVATPEDGRKDGLVKFCASAVHQTMEEVETECVFEEKKKVFRACTVSPSVLSTLSDSSPSAYVVPHAVLSDFALSTWHTILKHRSPLPCA